MLQCSIVDLLIFINSLADIFSKQTFDIKCRKHFLPYSELLKVPEIVDSSLVIVFYETVFLNVPARVLRYC